MHRPILLTVALLCFGAIAAMATPTICNPCLFYGGDWNGRDGMSNGINTAGSQVVYDNATVGGQNWIVSGIFTNNLVTDPTIWTGAQWEIRSGVSAGNGGTLVASGTGPAVITKNGQDTFKLMGVFASCSVPNVVLNAGTTYWFSCTLVQSSSTGKSFLSTTSDDGGFGNHIEGAAFFDSSFGENFVATTNYSSDLQEFSFGVTGTTIPEPSAVLLLFPGLLICGLLSPPCFAARRAPNRRAF